MGLVYKQLTKQIGRNKVFVILLLLLTFLTSLSFFFVKFSIDGNMEALKVLSSLSENQMQYKNALNSNTSLAYTFFASTIGLTAFVFMMFFYRFFRTNQKQMGCLKSLGFKDWSLCTYFIIFVAVLSIIGALLGFVVGYFLSSVLINANIRTYSVTGLVKGINLSSILIGLLGSTLVFCLIAVIGYSFVHGKESGELISGKNNKKSKSRFLRIANVIVGIIPCKNKFPLRIALRKPLAVVLIIVAVMGFSVCIILGQSLNISSKKVFHSQTDGHNYEYDTRYDHYRTKKVLDHGVRYLEHPAELVIGGYDIEQTVVGLYDLNELYELQNVSETRVAVPSVGTIYVNLGLADTYDVEVGDTLTLDVANTSYHLTVAEIATNAKTACIYMNAEELTMLLGIPEGSYNGLWSMDTSTGDGFSVDKEQRMVDLERNAVSNQISGIINQVIGSVVGCILIFLALYVNFQDNTRDMLLLSLFGYQAKEIRKMLIDVYRPIVCTSFVISIIPSIWIARFIQRSLSLSINDYMPFGTSIIIVILVFVGLNLIYWLVQTVFTVGINHLIRKEANF